jgi:hypothetical protein
MGMLVLVAFSVFARPASSQDAPRAEARVEVTATGAAGSEVVVRIGGAAGPLASYQGELRFDAAVVTFVSATFPPGVTGAANPVAPGRIRFAAASPGGAPPGPALRLVLRSADGRAVDARGLRVTIEEARVAR